MGSVYDKRTASLGNNEHESTHENLNVKLGQSERRAPSFDHGRHQRLTSNEKLDLADWNFNCLTSVAALGFGDIPPSAFFEGLRLVAKDGWVAFNIKETFLDRSDKTGFSRFIRELIFSEYLNVYQLERYTHRYSMEGVGLKYYALVGRISAPIPDDFLESRGIE